MKRFTLVSVAAAGLAAMSMSQITASGGKYTFKAKYTQGATQTYGMSMKMSSSAMPQAMNMGMTIVLKTVSVSGGNATMKVKAAGMTMNGKAMKTPAQEQTMVVDAHGKVLKGTSQNGVNSTLPTKPIAVGESWTSDNNVGTGMGAQKVQAHYTLTKIDNVMGKQVAVIAVSMTGSGANSLKGTGIQKILMSDGSLYSANIDMLISNPQVKDMKMNMTISRK